MKNEQLQSLINQIQSRKLSAQELILLLNDERLLVVANVLLTLPLYQLPDPRGAADAVAQVAKGSLGQKVVLGNTTLARLAAASLWWMRNDEAQEALESLLATFSQQERDDLQWFLDNNPLDPVSRPQPD